MFVCENIEISVVPFEDKRNFEPKHIYIPFRHIRSNETNDEQGLLFVEYDDQKLKLLQFLCAEYFQWERSFSIIKDLFDPKNTDEKIKNVLKGNSLNPNLIEHFSALEKDEVYLEREQQLQEFSEKGNLVKAVSGLPSPAQTQTDTQANNARPANKNISIKSKNQTSDTVPKSQKSKKVTESNNSVRKRNWIKKFYFY